MRKKLAIRDETYERLVAVKGKDESFSKLFDRLVNGVDSLESLKKLRGSAEFSEKKKMLRELEASRAEKHTSETHGATLVPGRTRKFRSL